MKFISAIALAFILTVSFGHTVLAVAPPNTTVEAPPLAPGEYKMLAPLPGLTEAGGENTNIGTYVPAAVKLIIGLATALAVILIVIGGFEYIMSASAITKSTGKERIVNALTGLLLVISSWVILNTLNPKLVNFSFTFENVGSNEAIDTTVATSTVQTPTPTPTTPTPTTAGDTLGGTSGGQAWGSDAGSRGQLTTAGITFNNNNTDCATIGQTGCTSVSMISPIVITDLQKLKTACDCAITVTGGTEYWLHGSRSAEMASNTTPHRPEGTVADLSLGTSVTDFLRKSGTKSTDYSTCVIGQNNGPERYIYQDSIYVNETIDGNAPHWHVCFK